MINQPLTNDKLNENYNQLLEQLPTKLIRFSNPKRNTKRVLFKNYILHKGNPRLRESVYVHIEHLIGEKAFANDIAFIEIGQLEGNYENQIELHNLKSYIDIEIKFRQ